MKVNTAEPFLVTERLALRRYTTSDFDALRTIISDPVTMRYYDTPYDDAGVARWIEWNLNNYSDLGFGLWVMERREDGAFLGDCGITMQIIDHRIVPEIGYHVHRDFWGRGYATEAARVCRDWAFSNTPFERLYSYMNAGNIASRRVAEKNGMTFSHTYTDGEETLAVYLIARKTWRENRC